MTPKPIPADIGEYLHYDPETGHLTWLRMAVDKGPDLTGRVAGARRAKDRPYIDVKFRGVIYTAARIAYFLMTGHQPIEIDHVDLDPSNNRWSNLRNSTRSQNASNRRGWGAQFKKGVYRSGTSRFVAVIGVNGRVLRLGTFDNEAAAHAAYRAAAERHHGDFARMA